MKSRNLSYNGPNNRFINGHQENGFSNSSGPSFKSSKVAEVFKNELKVFIKNIPNDGSDVQSQLQQLMSQYGEPIHTRYFSRRRGRDVVHIALFVMRTEAAAKNAVAAHGSIVEGRHIIVSTHGQYTQHPNCVYITNLPSDVDEEDLWQLFESKGNILFINIKNPVNLNTSDLPLEGEIIFETKIGAEEALSLNGSELKGSRINISLTRTELAENRSGLSVYVSGLPSDVTKERLMKFFDQSGVVRMVKINFKNLSAVLHFTSKEAVDSALRLDGKSLDNHVLSVCRREEEILNLALENPVYLSSIPESVKDVDIFLAFQDCGRISEVRFLPRKTPCSKRRAVIQFQYPDSVAKAMALDGEPLGGQPIRVGDSEKFLSTSHEWDQEREENHTGKSSMSIEVGQNVESRSSLSKRPSEGTARSDRKRAKRNDKNTIKIQS